VTGGKWIGSLIQTVENITKKALPLRRAEAPRKNGASAQHLELMAKNQISASRLADFRHWRWARVRFTEYDHVLEPVPSQNRAAGELSGFPAHLFREIERLFFR
jgi:hypothetical protein